MGSSKWRLSRFRGRLIVPEDLEELFQKQTEPWPSQRFLYQIKREGLLLGTSDSPYSFRDSMVPSHSRTEGDVLFSEDISCIWAHMNSVLQQNWSLPAAQGGQVVRNIQWVSLTGKVNAVIVMKNCTRTQLQLFSLEETNLNEVRVLQNDMLVLIIQGIIISQRNNKLFYLLLIVSEVMIVLFGWLSKEQQSKLFCPLRVSTELLLVNL